MRKYVRKFLVNTKGTKVQLKLLDSFAKVPDCVLIVCVCVCVCLLNTFYLTAGRVTQEETGI